MTNPSPAITSPRPGSEKNYWSPAVSRSGFEQLIYTCLELQNKRCPVHSLTLMLTTRMHCITRGKNKIRREKPAHILWRAVIFEERIISYI
jgi:hypothetical protein